MGLRLIVPKQLAGRSLSVGDDIPAVLGWLGSFAANPREEALSQVLPVLIEANRIEMDSSVRLRLLDGLRDITSSMLKDLRARCDAAHPNVAKHSQRRVLELRLLQELGYGYKLLVGNARAQGGAESEQAVAVVYWAIHYLGQQLLWHYGEYRPVSGSVWGELNLLYTLATQAGWAKAEVAGARAGCRTIDLAYRLLVLLTVLNPYSLLRGEAEKAYELLTPLAHNCRLFVPPEGRLDNGQIYIDLVGEAPPGYFKGDSRVVQQASVRVIELSGVKELMRQSLRVVESEAVAPGESRLSRQMLRDVLKRLLSGLRNAGGRRTARVAMTAPMKMTIGLNDCYELFRQAHPARSRTSDGLGQLSLAPLEERQTAKKVGQFTIDDPNLNIWDDKHLRVGLAELQVQLPAAYDATRTDVSAGGYGLRYSQVNELRLRVGDLIALRAADDPDTGWSLVDVRWKRAEDAGMESIGVRLLAPSACPVEVSVLDGRGKGGRPEGGLLIPCAELDHPEASLILVDSAHDEGDRLQLWLDGQRTPIKLTAQIDSAGGYSRYAFSVQNSGEA